MILLKVIGKGALVGEFTDRAGQECSIQESSLATEAAIWLGANTDEPGKGHRMLITQQLAQDLLPMLRHFVKTGHLAQGNSEDDFEIGTWVVGVDERNRGIEGRVIIIEQGKSITVQNNDVSGPEGQITCAWNLIDLMWAVIPSIPQEEIPNRYERLRASEIPR